MVNVRKQLFTQFFILGDKQKVTGAGVG